MLKILGRLSSANVQKITWLCDEVGIAYERQDVDYGAPDYLALNPNAKIPTIIDDGFVLWESNAILQYLCDQHGLHAWYPRDPKASARVRQWMDWASCECYRKAEPVWIGNVLTPPAARDPATLKAARDVLSQAVSILDRRLGESRHVAGDAITIADLPLAILAFRWFEMPIEREDYPNLRRWYLAIAERAAFRKNVIDVGIHRR